MSRHYTKAQQERAFDQFRTLGCVVCRHWYGQFREADVSHLVEGGRRRGNDDVIPECPWHHRGVVPSGFTEVEARTLMGPSRAHGSKPYRNFFAPDDELLRITNMLLEVVA